MIAGLKTDRHLSHSNKNKMHPLMLAVFMRVWVHSDVAFLSVLCLRVKLLGTDLLFRCQRGLLLFPRKQKTTSGKNLKKADTKGKTKIFNNEKADTAQAVTPNEQYDKNIIEQENSCHTNTSRPGNFWYCFLS